MALTQQSSKWARPSPTIRVGVLGLLAAFLLVLPLALAPRAEAYIYWATLGTHRSVVPNLDGTSVDPSFIRTPASRARIAVDATHLYWANRSTFDRSSAPTSTAQTQTARFITRSFARAAPETAARRRRQSRLLVRTSGAPREIGRANLDGTGAEQSFITGTSALRTASPSTPSTSTGRWRRPQSRLNRPRQPRRLARNHSFITATGHLPQGIAVDAEHIYWTAGSPAAIARANLDGSGVDRSFITHERHRASERRRRGRRPPRLLDPDPSTNGSIGSAAPTSTAQSSDADLLGPSGSWR